MSAPTLSRDLVVLQTRALKLPGIARTFEALARQARDAHWPHEDYLHEVLSAEQASRHESVIRQRLREARFPEVKTLDTFDFTTAEGVSATQLHTLARGEWVTAPENLIFAGPIGTGKTHLAIALGVEATKQKRRVLFTRAAHVAAAATRAAVPGLYPGVDVAPSEMAPVVTDSGRSVNLLSGRRAETPLMRPIL
jgi:phosphate starvation-inducible protein PhoH